MRALCSNMVPHSEHAQIRLSTTPHSTHTAHLLCYSHTIVARWTHTVHSHSCITKAEHTHTRRWQIWHPPPVITFLQPPPPSIMGAIPVTVGCSRCRKVLKSRRLFAVNLQSLLYVVVQMFWGEVCWRRHVVRYNSSERAAAGGAGTCRGKRRCVSLQVTGHASRKLQFVLITFTLLRLYRTSTEHEEHIQTHCWDVFFCSGDSAVVDNWSPLLFILSEETTERQQAFVFKTPEVLRGISDHRPGQTWLNVRL